MLAHSVYVSLKDNSENAKQNFIASGKKYLTGHPGVGFFCDWSSGRRLHATGE